MQRQIAATLAVALLVPCATPAFPQQAATPGPAQQTPQSSGAQSGESDSSTGQQQGPAPPLPASQTLQTDSSQTSPGAQQDNSAKPVGAAAAPAETATGVAVSRPAGAAIAPGKQRRVRSLLIKIGVVVAAGVAVGTVAALSHSSPSRPH
jgi:hypothetical protein